MSHTPATASQWTTVEIPVGFYCNDEPLAGFSPAHGPRGNTLHPDTDPTFEARLSNVFVQQAAAQPEVTLKRWHVAMPPLDAERLPGPDSYQPVDAPQSLNTTSVSAVLVDQQAIQQARIGFHFEDKRLASLKQRLSSQLDTDQAYRGVCGNLGYFMTENLNCGDHPWSHKRRFPAAEFQLPPVLSYLGFYHFAEQRISGFVGAHPGAVAVTRQGQVEILPEIAIDSYTLEIAGQSVNVDVINPPLTQVAQQDLVLFTPALPLVHQGAAVDFAPILTDEDRVNLFISNRGDGQCPHEAVIKVWHGACPLPSFGVVLSFKRDYFAQLFATHTLEGTRVNVQPHCRDIDLAEYAQILGGLVPVVIKGQSMIPTGAYCTAKQAETALDAVAHTMSPLAKTGKETHNFDPLIREPAGVFIQTPSRVGWILFDGRHEMSVGANIVDISNLLQRLQQADIDLLDGEPLLHALVIDGGSAMKAYAVDTRGGTAEIQLLNRVAAGGRNPSGQDSEGLNLYSTATFYLV